MCVRMSANGIFSQIPVWTLNSGLNKDIWANRLTISLSFPFSLSLFQKHKGRILLSLEIDKNDSFSSQQFLCPLFLYFFFPFRNDVIGYSWQWNDFTEKLCNNLLDSHTKLQTLLRLLERKNHKGIDVLHMNKRIKRTETYFS